MAPIASIPETEPHTGKSQFISVLSYQCYSVNSSMASTANTPETESHMGKCSPAEIW